jgi:hypothetical protein
MPVPASRRAVFRRSLRFYAEPLSIGITLGRKEIRLCLSFFGSFILNTVGMMPTII